MKRERELRKGEGTIGREVLKRGLLGIPIGIAIGHVLSIIFSAIYGGGYYGAVVPAVTDMVGSEIGAVTLQAVLCAVIGFGFCAGSVVWDIDEWSLVKQTGVYFVIGAAVLLPSAYVLGWMEHSAAGVLGYFAIFAAIFAVIWIVSIAAGKKNVKKLNDGLK